MSHTLVRTAHDGPRRWQATCSCGFVTIWCRSNLRALRELTEHIYYTVTTA